MLTPEYIHHSNLIEGFDDPAMDASGWDAWKFLSKYDKVTKSAILTTHYAVTENQDSLANHDKGTWRNCWVGVGGHTCPDPLEVPELMDNWIQLFNHHSLLPKELHIAFEKIHPFVDGNGRVGRLLMWHNEIKSGLQPTMIKYDERFEYYNWFNEL
jgi:Fic family protein